MKAALVQMRVATDIGANLTKVKKYLASARKRDANVVLFPECALTGYLGFGRTRLDDLDPVEIHEAMFSLQETCADLRIASIIGQYFKRCGRWYNNAVAIDDAGRLVASYDKQQLVDRDCYEVAPGLAPAFFSLNDVPCSMAICHDIRYPEVLRAYGSAGVRVHFHLFYGGRAPGQAAEHYQRQYDAHLATRAVENGMFLLAANASLNEQMVRSQARDTEGRCLAVAPNGKENLVVVDLDPAVAGDGWAAKRRSDLYPEASHPKLVSYFERGVWERKRYMIAHEEAALRPFASALVE